MIRILTYPLFLLIAALLCATFVVFLIGAWYEALTDRPIRRA